MRAALLSAALLGACTAASSDPGLFALLQVAGAQYVPGPPPAGAGGPRVIKLDLGSARVRPGTRDLPILGTLDAEATGVALGLEGDRGHWVLPAGVPDTETPTLPSIDALGAVSHAARPGPARLWAQATDAGGRPGPLVALALTLEELPAPSGALVVTLRWDRPVDLDLHVTDPTGAEVWANKPSVPAPASPAAPAVILDVDSNAACLIDGRNEENVIYRAAAPPGRYRVQVDTFSMCGQEVATWRLEVRADGALIASATGVALPVDAEPVHGPGAGLVAAAFELP